MRLRSGRVVEQKSHLENSLSDSDLSLLHLLMSRHENMSEHGDENGGPDPVNQEIIIPLRDYLHPPRQITPLFIILPINHHRLNFKPGTIQLLPTFHGMDSKNPYTHMKEFKEVCSTCMDHTVNEDVIRLKLFLFTLKDKSKMWLTTLPPRSIRTWREM